MIDDSLSDTQQWNRTFDMLVKDAAEIEQQEKQMSVEELKFTFSSGSIVRFKFLNEKEFVIMSDGQATIIDRSQAHLLMLYLQEQLGYVSISKDRLNE